MAHNNPPSLIALAVAAGLVSSAFAADKKTDEVMVVSGSRMEQKLEDVSGPIAVITSDDATYLETVGPLAQAIKAAKPAIHLLLAGAPGENEAIWRAAGVNDFVNVRSNNYELNQQLLKKAGVL